MEKAICKRPCTFQLALVTECLYFENLIQGSSYFGGTPYI